MLRMDTNVMNLIWVGIDCLSDLDTNFKNGYECYEFDIGCIFPTACEDRQQTQTKPNQTKPKQTKPNQTKPNQTKPRCLVLKHCLKFYELLCRGIYSLTTSM